MSPDQVLEQAGRRRQAVLKAADPLAVHVGIDDVGDVVHQRVVEVEDLVESGLQDIPDPQQEQDDDDVRDRRQGDVPHALHSPRAIDLGRLVQIWIDAGDRRQVDDRSPTDVLPDHGGDDDRQERVHLLQEQPRLGAENADCAVDDAVHGPHDAADHDPGHEVRQVADGLERLLPGDLAHLVEQQGEYDRTRKADRDLQEADADRVPQHLVELLGGEQPLE